MRLCSMMLAGLVVAATPAAADAVKIGAILTLSGPDATPGIQMDRGLKLYIKEHAQDLPTGFTIELIERDDIQILTGVLWTPNAAAIAPIATEAKLPFIISNAAGVSIPRLSPY